MSTKKPTAKKTTSKKAPVKKTAAKKVTKKTSAKQVPLKSFRPAADTEKFFSFRINQETVYWLIIGVIVLGFAAWIYKMQGEIHAIYDRIEQMQIESAPIEDLPAEGIAEEAV